jgi:putative transposase
MGLSRSGYYDWGIRELRFRAQEDEHPVKLVEDVHQHSSETYGYLRVHARLTSDGVACGKHRSARLTRERRLKTKATQHREVVYM